MQAQRIMTKVGEYCGCINHQNILLAQKKKKQDEEIAGDEVCQAVDFDEKALGIDCKIEGYNITIDMLKNILTDNPTPITMPLDGETWNNTLA